jgi:CHAT domain-containing protein
VAAETQSRAAFIWVNSESDGLELIVITPGSLPQYFWVPEAKSEELEATAEALAKQVSAPRQRRFDRYLPTAQALYRWLVKPLESVLQPRRIDTLIFCLGPRLRTLPLAMLHDGQQFLIEKYSVVRVPAFKLTDMGYSSLKDSQVLAMGASQFQDLAPLPAVPLEIQAIAQSLWPGQFFLNQAFTVSNLQAQRRREPFRIVHLATHADFQPGEIRNSFIQLWDQRLTLDQISTLNLGSPPVDLLVLSACRTAIGDRQAELGFAGLAIQSGAKSAIASLWSVSDAGTLGLMTEFYRQLRTAPTKAIALQKAQLALLHGQVRLEEGQLPSLRTINPNLSALPFELESEDFHHPYYWAAFTIIGNPW